MDLSHLEQYVYTFYVLLAHSRLPLASFSSQGELQISSSYQQDLMTNFPANRIEAYASLRTGQHPTGI